jgi:acetoacetyl-CoA synthetase
MTAPDPGDLRPIWSPSGDDLARARVTAFARKAAARHGFSGGSYLDLWRWSVAELDEFWAAVWEFFDVRSPTGYRAVRRGVMPDVRWFEGAHVSYVEHVFRDRPGAATALVDVRESSDGTLLRREVTWAELRNAVAALAEELARLGVRPGDRVVGYVPNAAEAVVAFLGTAALGAVWSGCGQDYAAAAAAQRFAQLAPVVLIAADGYRYGGREHDRRSAVAELRAALPTLRATIMFSRLGREIGYDEASGVAGGVRPWPRGRADAELPQHHVAFDHPLWVVFSSGTTGLPKGIVHSAVGVLLEHLKAMGLALDLGPRDCFFWYTSPSWMVWNYLVSGLLVGARIVCYDGSPSFPSLDTLWALAAEHRVTLLGTSPAHLRACAAAGLEPGSAFDLSALRSVGSSGSVLPADAYRYVAEHVGRHVRVNSTTGGTDVVSSFAGAGPTVAVVPGEISAPSLGVALDAWDEHGRPVRNSVGELVVTEPMPSMPIALWGDADGSRYRASYFDTFPGVWRHGDWITITDRLSVVVHGRSDSTLNRNGIRMGSGDIYRALEPLHEIEDCLVVGVEQPDGGYWMPLFVALADGAALDDRLRQAVVRAIREGASPKHVPDDIIEVTAVPHTLTGKKLEIPVKRILLGAPASDVADLGAVDRPDALLAFAKYAVSTGSANHTGPLP